MRLIGILGQAGSGKDEVGKQLVQQGFYGLALADPMKIFLMHLFDWSWEQLWGGSKLRNVIDPRYGFSPRETLQHLGTEWARSRAPDCHINFGLRRVAEICGDGRTEENWIVQDPLYQALPAAVIDQRWRRGHETPYDLLHGIYISDLRFRNEVEAVLNAGGEVYRIIRNARTNTTSTGLKKHASEEEQKTISDDDLTGIINNNSTLETLHDTITQLLETPHAAYRV